MGESERSMSQNKSILTKKEAEDLLMQLALPMQGKEKKESM